MANNPDKWYFTKEQLDNTPSRKCGYDKFKELSYRQQTANFIQDMGQKLKVSQLCINTAIVYMHRFYVFHSFTHFPWYQMAAAALFLAAKVEEQPRKLEHVIRVANMCRNNRDANIDVTSERYIAQSQDLVFNENVLLQTLGFDVAIDHPHTHVVRCCSLVRASKDLAQSSYFMASNSLHLTTMCLQYKPTVVACFCIHLASKWSKWEIPLSSEQKEWFVYVDPTVTVEMIQQLTAEFLTIYEHCPSRLKEKIMSIGDNGQAHNVSSSQTPNSLFDQDVRKITDTKESHSRHDSKSGDAHKHRSSRPHDSSQQQHHQREREYREKKEREKLAAQQHAAGMKLPPPNLKPPMANSQSGSHHGNSHSRPMSDSLKHLKHHPHPNRPPPPSAAASSSSAPYPSRAEPRDILREAVAKETPFGIATKDFQMREHSKDPKQREASTSAQPNNYTAGYNGEKSRGAMMLIKQEPGHHMKHPPIKTEVEVKREPGHESTSGYMNKMNSSGLPPPPPLQKLIKPLDTSKSVPKQVAHTNSLALHHQNDMSSMSAVTIKKEIKEEPRDITAPPVPTPHQPPIVTKSLFSPVKSPPKKSDLSCPSLSPIMSPLSSHSAAKRNRNYSSGSEPELRPVLQKIDEMEGYKSLTRDTTIGINKLHQVPDMIQPITDKPDLLPSTLSFSKEMKPPDMITPLGLEKPLPAQPIGLLNGIETDSKLISSLLKEAPTIPHLLVSKQEQQQQPRATDDSEKEYHQPKRKKNKEKHKHKDKSRDETKEKKKKHKDKDREKHKHHRTETTTAAPPPPHHQQQPEPIKLKIQKDRIKPVAMTESLKLKISTKDVLKTDSGVTGSGALCGSGGGDDDKPELKIKIPKEKIQNFTPTLDKSRKRERDHRTEGDGGAPQAKTMRISTGAVKQNGRSSSGGGSHHGNHNHHHKVNQPGNGNTNSSG